SLFFLLSYSIRPPVSSTLLPYTTLFRSRLTALEQPIIPLGVEKAVFLKSCLLKTVIYVGSQDKIVFVFHQIEQFVIDRFRCIHIAVDPDIAAPVCPVFLQRIIWVKSAGIH